MSGLIVDIGTGDGSFALALAKANLDSFVIGVDPNHQNLMKTSLKSYPDGSTDALPNLMFVLASAENLPLELDGMANKVFISPPQNSDRQVVSWRPFRNLPSRA